MGANSGKVQCQYCTAQNELEEHRCKRCGRRLTEAAHQPYSRSAAAPVLQPEITPTIERIDRPSFGPQLVPPQAKPEAPVAQPVLQASLFGPQEVLKNVQKPAPKRTAPPNPHHRPRVDKTAQGTLDFSPMGSRTLRTEVEAAIFCNAQSAPVAMRIMATIFDTILPLMGVGALFAAIHFAESDINLTAQPLWFYGVVLATCFLVYRLLFCLANGDTPGIRWTGLRVLNFDGRRPTRAERFNRLIGGCISSIAAGIGLVWALYDEEHLTWHDLMSKTFPTVATTQPRMEA